MIGEMNLSWIKIIGINLIIIVFFVVIVEVIFGNWLSDDNINHLLLIKDRTVTYRQDLYPGDELITYTRDALGFRGDYDSVDDIEILTIGGSTTDQRFLNNEKTWQFVIADEFKKEGKNVDVVNAGIDGASTFGHIKAFDYWLNNIENLKVDYILLFVGVNDFYKDPRDPFDDLLNEEKDVEQFLKNKSVFFYLFRVLEGIFLVKFYANVGHTKIIFSDYEWTDKPLLKQDSYSSITQERVKSYGKRLSILFKKIKNMDAKAILVTQGFSRYRKDEKNKVWGVSEVMNYDGNDYNGVDQYYLMSTFNQQAMQTCSKYGAICIDLANKIDLVTEDYYDWTHTTPVGARKIGQFIFKHIKTLY